MSSVLDPLFKPFSLKTLSVPNRFVMAPMTRSKSPGQVPTAEVAAYYRRRVEGGVGLIVTEGTVIDHPASDADAGVPRFYGADALAGAAPARGNRGAVSRRPGVGRRPPAAGGRPVRVRRRKPTS